jgi:hypothetical protein
MVRHGRWQRVVDARKPRVTFAVSSSMLLGAPRSGSPSPPSARPLRDWLRWCSDPFENEPGTAASVLPPATIPEGLASGDPGSTQSIGTSLRRDWYLSDPCRFEVCDNIPAHQQPVNEIFEKVRGNPETLVP